MTTISATELNKHPGTYLTKASREPIVINKNGGPVVVMVAYEKYLQLEDAFWGEAALEADKEKSIGKSQTMKFLLSDD